MTAILEDSGFQVEALLELTESHRRVAERLASEYQRQETEIADELGRLQVKELIKSHRLWSQWMSKGRVRKYAIVAGKRPRSLVDVERVAGPGDVVFPDLHIDT